MSKYSDKIESFLKQFFGASNKITLERIGSKDQKYARFKPWVERLQGDHPQFTVLPHVVDNKVTWYALSFTDAQQQAVANYLYDFIGPSFSNVQPYRSIVRDEDPVDSLVDGITCGRFIRFGGMNDAIWDRLQELYGLLRHTPRRRTAVDSLSRTLKNFYYAVINEDRGSAERYLSQLADRHRLSAYNVLFLRIYMLSTWEFWSELYHLQQFHDLVQVRKPWAVTEALIRAVYHLEVAPMEKSNNWPDLGVKLVEKIVPQYGLLFGINGPLQHLEVAKMFLFKALVNEDNTSVNALVNHHRFQHPLQTIVQAWGFQMDPVQVAGASLGSLEEIQALYMNGRMSEALRLGVQQPPSFRRTYFLLAIAYELDTLAAHAAAVHAYSNLSQQDKAKVNDNKQAMNWLKQSVAFSGEGTDMEYMVPFDWFSWVDSLERRTPTQNERIARQALEEWDPHELIANPDSLSKLIESLKLCYDTPNQASVELSLPHLFAFLQKSDNFPSREHVPVLLELMYLLVLLSHGSPDELALCYDLAEMLTRFGLDGEQYRQLLDCFELAWDIGQAVVNVDWLLDTMELLYLRPCHDVERRGLLVSNLVSTLYDYNRRLTSMQCSLLLGLLKDYNREDLVDGFHDKVDNVDGEDDKDVFEVLQGKRIGLYTLEETVAQRFQRRMYETLGLEVQYRCDHTVTEPLKNLVLSSDLIIVAWKSAKHAATSFITQNAGNVPIVFPRGKGSSSIWNALEQHLLTAI